MYYQIEGFMSKQQASSQISARHFVIAAKHAETYNLNNLKLSLQWVALISELIYNLQHERGLSNIYLVTQDKSKQYTLFDQAQLSDKAITEFRQAFQSLYEQSQKDVISPALLNAVGEAFWAIDAIYGLRERIKTFAIQPADSTQELSWIIEKLIQVIFEVAYLASDPKLTRALSALFHLIQGKELVAQERGWTAIGFARGYFVERLQERLKQLTEKIDEVFEGFQQTATDDQQARFSALIKGPQHEVLNRLRDVRNKLFSKADIDPQIAEEWYTKATDYMDQLHIIEQASLHELQVLCDERIKSALQNNKTIEKQLSLAINSDVTLSVSNPSHPIYKVLHDQRKKIDILEADLKSARDALKIRKLTEQAKAILQENLKLDEASAHRQLQQSAMQQQVPVQVMAQRIIETFKKHKP
ncbi:MAG TPA: hypothetical protein DE276_01660 [Oceanospirillaceae bacterium]|nr:hypothetical protein [Oceanospirillaceae bacterium]